VAQRRGRTPVCLFTAAALVVALLPIEVVRAAESPLVSQSFVNNSVPVGQWTLPALQSGTNGACLSGGPTGTTSSVPVCASPPDSSGSGSLRLTSNAGSQVGAVFYSASLPTSQGLDITFDTYQFNGSGADGIAFTLAAANPANPLPPSFVGPSGANLGYAAGGTNGTPDGYLGVGLDAYGGYEGDSSSGSGCTTLSPLNGGAYAESVTTRGPGNGSVGYCMLASTATIYHNPGAGSGAGNVGVTGGSNNALDNRSATARSATTVEVPVEVAINPSGTATSTSSGLSVPANSWIVAFSPLYGAVQATQTGLLPTTLTNAALATFPASWINQTTKIPYQLTFGWTASTGGANETHEINNVVAQSLLGPVPALTLTTADNENGLMVAGNHGNLVLSPGTSASGGTEANTLTVTDTLPAGMTPGTATSPSDWSCGTAAQVVTCTYTPASAIAAGTALPNITIPITLAAGLSGSVSSTAGISSTDALPATSVHTVTVSAFTASPAPASQTFGQSVTYAAVLPSSTTGTVVFTTGSTTLCTAALPTLTCAATNAPIGTDSVTASYSGDANFAPQVATTSVTITKASVTFTESAAPASVGFGSADTLAATGLPANATGTVTFAAGGSTLCVATLAVTNCLTSTSLVIATYTVTATYSGDGNYSGATATGASFTVAKANTSFTEAAAPASVPFGTADTVSESGLPTGATGTVTFASGGSTLCTATLPTASCNTSSALALGAYPVTATYSGGTNYNGSTATGASFTVVKADTTFTESAAPASIAYGAQDTLSVAGLSGAATGTVTFATGGSTLCTATLPATSCQTSVTLAPASYSVTATYSGGTNFNGSTATGASFTITKASTSMTESASPASITFGAQDTLSVSGLAGGASGTLTFTAAGATLCTATLPATSCQTAASLAAGTYSVTATFPGDGNFSGTTATGASFTVTKATPTFTESASPASIGFGSQDTLSVSGLSSTATGTVTFISGIGTLCVATLPAASCLTSTSLPQAQYGVLASYSGDASNNSAIATGASFMVVQATTSFTESAAPASVAFGTADTLSASGIPAAATGTVTFFYSGGVLCTATLPALSCQTATTRAPGTYAVTASYSGDVNNTGASATGASFTITKATSAMTESASPASIAFGAQDTLSSSGLPVGATGTVTFSSGTALCVATLPATSCQSATTLAPGSYPVTATFSGDGNYGGTSASGASFTVVQANTSFTEGASPATVAYGSKDTLTITGLPATATGTVTFTSGGTTLCTATLPAQSCQTSVTLSAATYPVSAAYSGDADFNASTATGASFIVTGAPTSMTETASPASIAYGAQDTLSVTGLPGDATGTVAFTSGATALCTATLPATSCQTFSSLNANEYDVTASFSGGGNYDASTATGASFTVTQASTSFTESRSQAITTYGTANTLSESGLPADATGTVTFSSGAVVLCIATLPASSCTTSPTLTSGNYPFTATYSGDANYDGATATGASFTVTKATPAIEESASPVSITYGSRDSLSITGLAGDATGTVTFSAGGTTLCTATLPATTCQTATTLAAGSYDVTATYSGDGDYNGTTAIGASFTVTQAFPSMTESAGPGSIAHGSHDTLSVAGLPTDATGTVTFTSGGDTLCTATLPATSCTTPASLVPGTYAVTATYSGDGNYNGTTATGASFTVTLADTSIAESASPASITYGSHDTVSVTGLPSDATGTVTFNADGVTLCTAVLPATSCQTATTLTGGIYAVTATYSGDGNDNSSSATGASFIVTRAAPSMIESASPGSIAYTARDALSVSGLPGDATGTVTFSSGGIVLCTATLPATSCQTAVDLAAGSYAVTAIYSGDGSYSGATATGASFIVTRVGTAMSESASPAVIASGAQDTLSVSGLPGGATGTVTFMSGSTVLCVATLPALSCATAASLLPGDYDVTAIYSGDINYFGSTATGATFSMSHADTSLSESASPTTVAYGTGDTLSVSGLPGDATGTVTFTSGSTTLCTATLPALSCTTSATLFPGSYAVTATYSGDGRYDGSTATGAVFTVTTVTTSISESASPMSVAFGDEDTLSVSGIAGGATGTVTFSSGGVILCTATLPATSCQTSATLSAGSYGVTAVYSGDENYDGATATGAGFTVTPASTSMTESAAPATIAFGQQITLSVSGLPGAATGTITFTSGAATLCVAILPAMSCATATTLTPGTYPVTATYSGDLNNQGALATGATFTVTLAPTSFSESASPATVAYGTTDTLSVSGLPGGTTGTVTFTSGSTTLCTVTLPVVSCATTAALFPGTYPVSATYSGDSNHNGGTQTGAGFTVTRVATPIDEFTSPATISYGTQDTLSVTGIPGGATGTVTFTADGITLCTAVLPATSCQSSVTLAPGTYDVTATYTGDVDHAGASASDAAFAVTKSSTSMAETASPAVVAVGSADSLAVSGLPSGSTGTVTFTSGGVTLCTATLPVITCATGPSLALGAYNVTATYSGDANDDGTTATGASFTVAKVDANMTESAAPASIPYGTADVLSVAGLTGGASGTVTFTTDGITLCVATLPALTCTTPTALEPAAYPVTATYSGDGDNGAAVATGATFTVVQAATTMGLTISPAQILPGGTVTASVTGLPAGATGTVIFTIGTVVVCAATLPATSCSATIDLPPGSYDVLASYSGDAHYSASSVMGGGGEGMFSVLGAATTPDTGAVTGWQLMIGMLLLVAGICTVAVWPLLSSRRGAPSA
jgi:large repetitive protein